MNRLIFFMLCVFTLTEPCNSTEGRRSLITITKEDIDAALNKLFDDGFEGYDDTSCKAYDEFNSLINNHGSIHPQTDVKKKLYGLNLTDSSGSILESVRQVWEDGRTTTAQLLTFSKSHALRCSYEEDSDSSSSN